MSCADYSRHKKNRCGEGTRYFDKRERSGQPERCGIEKPPVSQEASSSNNKREPIVPIGPAGMVRRRVTSSVKRRGTVVPLLCSIFLPARICRKAAKLDVVKDRVTSPTTREDVGSSHLIHRSSQAIALETAGQ